MGKRDVLEKIGCELRAEEDKAAAFTGVCDVKRVVLGTLEMLKLSAEDWDILERNDNVLSDIYEFSQDESLKGIYSCAVIRKYLEHAKNVYFSELLYDRMKAEYDARIKEICCMKPAKIIGKAYEIVTLETVLTCFGDAGVFSNARLFALAELEKPLAKIYGEWTARTFDITMTRFIEMLADEILRGGAV